jgi:hypothetical protein
MAAQAAAEHASTIVVRAIRERVKRERGFRDAASSPVGGQGASPVGGPRGVETP